MRVLFLFGILFIVNLGALKAQDRIVFDDRVNLLSSQVEYILSEKFKRNDISFGTTIEIKEKCRYYFAKIYKGENRILTELENCDGELLGSKSHPLNLEIASDDEKAVVIYYAVMDIIESSSESVENLSADKEEANENINSEHDSRYFFAPSALPVKKSELYYNTLYFLAHDIQYGVTDRFTLGVGTTIIGFPFYFTAKYSIPIQENSHLAVGNLLMAGTYGSNFIGNLAFATYTYGNSHTNISLGAGHLYFNANNNNSNSSSSVVGNLSGILRAGKYFYLLSENYLFNFNTTQSASRVTSLPDGTFIFQEAEFEVQRYIWYGVTGIRFVRKNNDLVSWQFGLTHMLFMNSEIPAPFNSGDWNSFSFNEGTRMITFPTISYTRKFKL